MLLEDHAADDQADDPLKCSLYGHFLIGQRAEQPDQYDRVGDVLRYEGERLRLRFGDGMDVCGRHHPDRIIVLPAARFQEGCLRQTDQESEAGKKERTPYGETDREEGKEKCQEARKSKEKAQIQNIRRFWRLLRRNLPKRRFTALSLGQRKNRAPANRS